MIETNHITSDCPSTHTSSTMSDNDSTTPPRDDRERTESVEYSVSETPGDDSAVIVDSSDGTYEDIDTPHTCDDCGLGVEDAFYETCKLCRDDDI